jgi:RyR domain
MASLEHMDLDPAMIDRLAQAIHENYLAEFAPGGPAWADLSADLREANRAQARAIVHKLASVGTRVEPGRSSVPFAFTPHELERLARAEHRRWVAQRRAAGWTYAAVRDDRRRRHPMIIKWEKLPEREREKDRDAVRHIPDVLAQVGLQAVRRPGPAAE